MKKALVTFMFALLLGFVAPVSAEKPLVVVSLPPLAEIIKEALGEQIEVVYLVPPGVEPHQYQLSPDQVKLLEEAEVIVTTGHLPAEQRILELKEEGRIGGRVLGVKDYARFGFHYLPERWYGHKANPHGMWLDPTNALAIAKAVVVALAERHPEMAGELWGSYERFETKVEGIMEAYSGIATGKRAIVELPSQQYALEWMGLEVIASIKPEAEVPARSLDELASLDANIVVYDENTPEALKRAAKELSGRMGIPLTNITVLWTGKPYTEVLAQNARSIVTALKGEVICLATEDSRTEYALLSFLVGVVLGVAIGVVIRKCPI
ncbi:metal ABC transporter solute-binding protein, Zn/Mn family [Pyrococcus yayanosii]|uniref:Putative ABC transporter, periplasmic binding protein n=1 Tax=Pyrococcus yayanosii (strain CH1 / JCM 16557) TaxID=529709 RepID=F8AIF2_PYRYC|nr:zinc ABC transporter substrate-binding protein [Pyrococcus yayanosii]AEH25557.1 putative ABC transporter, periplasmic binding protein [Pyrococcus yayanosii CH1]